MKFVVTGINISGSDKGTSQSEWRIAGTLDGTPVELRYLDEGNNAEYDTCTEFERLSPAGQEMPWEEDMHEWIALNVSEMMDMAFDKNLGPKTFKIEPIVKTPLKKKNPPPGLNM